MKIVRHLLSSFIFLSFIALPLFASAQKIPEFQVPSTIGEAKEGALNIGDKIIAAIPRAIAGIWKNEVVPLWKETWDWTKEEVWQKRLQPAFETILDKTRGFLGQEVEKRKPLIEQELEQEKQEIKEDIESYGKSAGKGLWERFLGLFSGE